MKIIVLSSILSLLMGLSFVSEARNIPIVVKQNPPVSLHLKMIKEAYAGDTLVLYVTDGCCNHLPTICRYVSALKSSSATIRLSHLPDMIRKLAYNCHL